MNAGLALLRRAFRLAKKSRKIGEVPEFELFPLDNARKGFFERVNFERLMLELPDYLRPAFHAAYLTGWRVQSELLTRRRADVDLEKGWLYLEAGVSKNGKPRQFPLDAPPELRSVIAAQLERTRAPKLETGQVIPWLFHKAGQPIKNFRHAWRAACKRAEVPDAIPHDFRRAAVRNLERAGVPPSSRIALVGHETAAVYQRYAVTDEEMLKEAVAKLAAFHGLDTRAERTAVIPISNGGEF